MKWFPVILEHTGKALWSSQMMLHPSLWEQMKFQGAPHTVGQVSSGILGHRSPSTHITGALSQMISLLEVTSSHCQACRGCSRWLSHSFWWAPGHTTVPLPVRTPDSHSQLSAKHFIFKWTQEWGARHPDGDHSAICRCIHTAAAFLPYFLGRGYSAWLDVLLNVPAGVGHWASRGQLLAAHPREALSWASQAAVLHQWPGSQRAGLKRGSMMSAVSICWGFWSFSSVVLNFSGVSMWRGCCSGQKMVGRLEGLS